MAHEIETKVLDIDSSQIEARLAELGAERIRKTRLVVDVRNGDDDFPDFYCPTVEWDWGDGTVSANAEDCDPYEAGKSVIKRRFSTEHTFRLPGAYRVAFRLKQSSRVVGMSSVNVQVRAGISQF